MKKFGDLIYTPEQAPSEVISKAETHTPKIEAPEKVKAEEPFKVRISVGPHPNQAVHSIRYIEVYFEEEERTYNPIHVATAVLGPEIAEPDITLTLKLKKSGTLYAIEYCNLHGLWESRKKITIE
jgi:superoxide reductase